MKSIVEEASSIKQAIENGWRRLGEPTVFSVKVLEKPETSFLGFSKKPAKVALIVEEKSDILQIRQQFGQEGSRTSHSNKKNQKPPTHQDEVKAKKEEESSSEEFASKWSEQRVVIVKDWLKKSLTLMGKESATFEMRAEGPTLQVIFTSALFPDKKNERFLFASIGHLMMETLRNKSKKILRNMRIVISNR